jgi:hypothetical protein
MALKRIEFDAEGEEPIWADISRNYSSVTIKVVLGAYKQETKKIVQKYKKA